jgi:hypothetical protein
VFECITCLDALPVAMLCVLWNSCVCDCLQILMKEGVLNKLSRKEMQPRMFFLVSVPQLFLIDFESRKTICSSDSWLSWYYCYSLKLLLLLCVWHYLEPCGGLKSWSDSRSGLKLVTNNRAAFRCSLLLEKSFFTCHLFNIFFIFERPDVSCISKTILRFTWRKTLCSSVVLFLFGC